MNVPRTQQGEVTNLKALHASCILSSNERTKNNCWHRPSRLQRRSANHTSPAVLSCRVNTRDLRGFADPNKSETTHRTSGKVTPLNCMITACVIFLAAARFVPLGKASFHALEGFNNLFPFVFPAHAKFF